MSGPGDGEEIREERTRVKTRSLNREAAAELVSLIGPCEGGRVFQALLAATETGKRRSCRIALSKRRKRNRRLIRPRVRQDIRTFRWTR